MPPKVKSLNGFTYFAEHRVKEQMRRRLKRHVSIAEAIDEANDIWKTMTDEDKESWKTAAKEYKLSDEFQREKMETKERYYRRLDQNTDPKPVRVKNKSAKANAADDDSASLRYYDDVLDDELFGMKRERDRDNLHASLTWKAPPHTSSEDRISTMKSWLASMKFVLISSQSYCETREHDFPPCELSAITFSLYAGVISKQNFLIGHGVDAWPNVETYNAACMKENETGIPVDVKHMPRGYRLRIDYKEMLKELVEMVGESECKMKLVLRKEWNGVMGAIAWLRGVDRIEELKESNFVCIEDLCLSFAKLTNLPITDDRVCSYERAFDTSWELFMQHPNVVCSFHYEQAVMKSCAMAAAHRAVFSFFDLIGAVDCFNVSLTESHFPTLQSSNGAQGNSQTDEQQSLSPVTNATTAKCDTDDSDGFGYRPSGFSRPKPPPPPPPVAIDYETDMARLQLSPSSNYAQSSSNSVDLISFNDSMDDNAQKKPKSLPPSVLHRYLKKATTPNADNRD